ncbi:MAG: hypothetical protein WC797_00885 [Candidatus Paceibacterota bacterium]|jgi:hypothetical protein
MAVERTGKKMTDEELLAMVRSGEETCAPHPTGAELLGVLFLEFQKAARFGQIPRGTIFAYDLLYTDLGYCLVCPFEGDLRKLIKIVPPVPIKASNLSDHEVQDRIKSMDHILKAYRSLFEDLSAKAVLQGVKKTHPVLYALNWRSLCNLFNGIVYWSVIIGVLVVVYALVQLGLDKAGLYHLPVLPSVPSSWYSAAWKVLRGLGIV